jgi:hypothetical protein
MDNEEDEMKNKDIFENKKKAEKRQDNGRQADRPSDERPDKDD